MSEEWGPWIEHDGKGCPVKGQYAMWERANGQVIEGIPGTMAYSAFTGLPVGPATGKGPQSWTWHTMVGGLYGFRVIRYRIRKPRALLQLIEMVENLPAPAQPRVDA